MIRTTARVLLFSLFALTVTTAFAVNKPLIDIQHWQTANGVRVYFVKSGQLPMLDIRIAFAAGSAHDGSTPGLAPINQSTHWRSNL